MSFTPIKIFQKLMALGPPADTESRSGVLKRTGMLIDLAGDLERDDGTERALQWCEQINPKTLTKPQLAVFDYFRANAWANRKRLKHRDVEAAWQWEQPELQNEIIYLRSATQSVGFEKFSKLRRCQTLTNLGNQLNTVGRCV